MPLSEIASGEEIANELGNLYVFHNSLDTGDFYGRRRLRELTDMDMNAVALLANDRRLVNLEEQILGLHRTGDIPGSEIPQRYFDWLRRRDARLLADLLAAAKLHWERGDAQACEHLLTTLHESGETDVAAEACRLLSLLHKRAGRWEQAALLWEGMIARDAADLFAVEELAKYHEHRCHDFSRALELVETALADSRWQQAPVRERLLYRQRRLMRRAGKDNRE